MKFLIILLLFFQLSVVFPQNNLAFENNWDVPAPRSFSQSVVPGLITFGEITLVNGIFMVGNYIYGYDWAIASRESIYRNFTSPWVWEHRDGFIVNFMGHPFQGSLYYSSARANGFGFYDSLIFSAFGSFTWEVFYEKLPASINDLYYTVFGSLAAGEMSYRLYMEAHAAGLPQFVTFLLSPSAGLHRLLTGWEPPPSQRNMHELRVFLGGGYSRTESLVHSYNFNGFYGDAGFFAVYGNPFEQDSRVPYRHFEFTMAMGMFPGQYQDIRIISDGYLLSFSPIYDSRNTMSMGLSLSMDFISRGAFQVHDSTFNQFSNALNWAIKYQHIFSPNNLFQIKAHAGFTFLAASKFYNPDELEDRNNYGYGLNTKIFLNYENRYLGRLELDFYSYVMWNFPGTSPLVNSRVNWIFTDLTYSRMITQHFSLGVTLSLAREWGRFTPGFPDTNKKSDSLMFFVAWNM